MRAGVLDDACTRWSFISPSAIAGGASGVAWWRGAQFTVIRLEPVLRWILCVARVMGEVGALVPLSVETRQDPC